MLCDPPLGAGAALAAGLAAPLAAVLADSGLLLVETDARTEPHVPLDPITSRRYGSARLTLFSP